MQVEYIQFHVSWCHNLSLPDFVSVIQNFKSKCCVFKVGFLWVGFAKLYFVLKYSFTRIMLIAWYKERYWQQTVICVICNKKMFVHACWCHHMISSASVELHNNGKVSQAERSLSSFLILYALFLGDFCTSVYHFPYS